MAKKLRRREVLYWKKEKIGKSELKILKEHEVRIVCKSTLITLGDLKLLRN